MREALSPYIMHIRSPSVVHQWAQKQYVQRSSTMPPAHAQIYAEHAVQHVTILSDTEAAPSSSSALLKLCAPFHPCCTTVVLCFLIETRKTAIR
jgi:hypothetical protein